MSKYTRSVALASVGFAGAILSLGLAVGPASAHSGTATFSSLYGKAVCEEDRRLMVQSGHSTTPCKLNASGTKYFFNYWH